MQDLLRDDNGCSNINSKTLIHRHHAAIAQFEPENKALIADSHAHTHTPRPHPHPRPHTTPAATPRPHTCPHPADVDADTEHPLSPPSNRYSGIQDLLRDDNGCSNINSKTLIHGHHAATAQFELENKALMPMTTPTHHAYIYATPCPHPCTMPTATPRPHPADVDADTEHPFSPASNRSGGIQDMLRSDKRCSNLDSERLVHGPQGRRPQPDSSSKTRHR
jgi:hypothetical protein